MNFSALVLLFGSATLPAGLVTHGGLVSPSESGWFELVVGPERLAVYLFNAKGEADAPGKRALTLEAGDHEPLELLAAGDHFEVGNPLGTSNARPFVAILRDANRASAARFAFDPAAASTFHDHRAYHGGVVGMVGERHLELALVPAGKQSELQLYVTDAYRRPIALDGLSARVQLSAQGAHPMRASAGSFVARVPRPVGPLDAHVEVNFPGETQPTAMDFYQDLRPASPSRTDQPIEVRVSANGFSPSRISASPGLPLRLRFLRISQETCGKQVVFPSLGITRDLPFEQPVEVDVTAPKGELAFTCGMHMFKGSVVGL